MPKGWDNPKASRGPIPGKGGNMAEGKVVLKFDVFPGEKEKLEALCKSLGITKIEFLRKAIAQAEKEGK
jgi:hypothetical protein